jgi:hypothetical protein
MRFTVALSALILCTAAYTQSRSKLTPQAEAKPATVPLALDHNRVVINIDLLLPDGSAKRVRAWVDNGDSDLWMSKSLAALMGLTIICNGQVCGAASPPGDAPIQIMIGTLKVALASTAGIKVPGLAPPVAASAIAPGTSAEIKIPSTTLRNYDVLIDFPDHQFTIAEPGSLKFNGVDTKVIVNPQNGLIQVPSQIERKKYNLGLDVGSPISYLSQELFESLSAAHSDWPRLTGAIGPANVSGSTDEPKRKLMRVDRLQFGPLFLTDMAVAEFSGDQMTRFENRFGGPTVGLLGSEALLNYRVGLDYAHSTVYFDIGRLFDVPDFDVVGLILRREDDGRFTILGVADYEGKPSVPQGDNGVRAGDFLVAVDGIPVRGSTLGQVWSMLGGLPGTERTLTVERAGRQLTIAAQVQHFLGDAPQENQAKKRSKKTNN